jgi:hypothetical protein
VQGPIDVTDQVAMFSATGHICKGFGIKWKQVTSNPWYPLAPEWNVQICGAEVHLSSEHAQIVGYPTAVSLAIVLEGGVSQMICNWMGDDGFLKTLDCASRHPIPLGYTNWITGKVVKKYQAGQEGLVDLEGECRDQNGALAMPSTATVRLPRRTVVPK